MASEPGGRAEKLGNEFERLWAVRHLIDLIAGTATTILIEPLGNDERGVDFWVGRLDRTREAHQCKRENGTTGSWSVARLAAKQVISNAKFQLDRDPSHRFVFASADKVPHLSDFAERAGRCNTPAEFVNHLAPTSKDHLSEFETLCRHLKLDPKHPDGAARVLDFLRRFRPEIVDKNRLRHEVESHASRWISGEPKEIVDALVGLVAQSNGIILREPDVIDRLPSGSRPRDLAKEPTLHAALGELRARFDRSYRHLLIGGEPLGRRETADLLAKLTSDDGPRLVLLHGPGGSGKSGVVFELVEQLGRRDIPCLPLRLDRDLPGDSPGKFGHSLELPGSPANCLAAVAGERAGVLILDQIDAIRWTAAHSSHAWDTCELTIFEALESRNLRVVVVCRSFDVEDDPRIKSWKSRPEVAELKLGPLDDPAINAVVAACGVTASALNSGQRRVLGSPQGLYLWRSLHEGDDRPPEFRTMTDLMRKFWETTRRELKKLRPGHYEEVLDALVAHMDRRGTLDAPGTVVERWPVEVDALLSMNVVVRGRGRRLLFAHQSSLDYLTAVRVLSNIQEGGVSVLEWLKADDQSLFRRGQLRQLLTLLRDVDPEQYVESMRGILVGDGVRFHLKHLALQFLGNVEAPIGQEVDLVLDLIGRPEWIGHIFSWVLVGRETWFDVLHKRRVLAGWLGGEDERRVTLAIHVIERVVGTRGEAIESLLLDRGRERWPGRLAAAVWRTPSNLLTEGLFEAVVGLKRRGEWKVHGFVNWKELAAVSPDRCLRLLEARIGRDLDGFETGGAVDPEERMDREDSSLLVDLAPLARAADAMPFAWWDRLLPYYRRTTRYLRQSRRGDYDRHGSDLGRLARQNGRVLRAVLVAAGRAMAATAPDSFWDRVGSEARAAKPIARLLARCIPHGPDARADSAIRWLLADRSRLRCGTGDRGAVYRPAWRLLRRYAKGCSDALFAELQAAILAHRPRAERDSYRFYHDRGSREAFWGDQRFDVLQFNDLGLGQHLLLSAVPRGRLTPDARSWAGVLRRKFGPIMPLLKGRPRHFGGRVGSTIPEDRLSRLSDRNWLGIARGDWSRRPRGWKQMGPDRLGELSVRSFASDLQRVAVLQPGRFARLALRFPIDSDPEYPVAILRALAERNPPGERAEGQAREPATVEQVEGVIRRFVHLEGDLGFAVTVCYAIQHRPAGDWSIDTMSLLTRLASGHADPLPGRYGFGEPDQPNVVQLAINCVRGLAAGAIEAVLFVRPERLGILRSAVDSLLDDPHPAVRVAAVGLALPLWNIDHGVAIDAFLRACSHRDDEVLRSYDLNHFLGHTILEHADRFKPLIGRMAASAIGEVAKSGAGWAAAAWSYRGLMEDIAIPSAEGNRWQRMGVAEALAASIAKGYGHDAALVRLQILFDDQDKDVRGQASWVFRHDELVDGAPSPALAEAFVGSRALDENVYGLLHGLERLDKPLVPYARVISALAARFAGPLSAEAVDYRTRRPLDAGLLAKVLLRLYEQSEHDRALRLQCLDAWDNLLREGIGYDILQKIDSV